MTATPGWGYCRRWATLLPGFDVVLVRNWPDCGQIDGPLVVIVPWLRYLGVFGRSVVGRGRSVGRVSVVGRTEQFGQFRAWRAVSAEQLLTICALLTVVARQ